MIRRIHWLILVAILAGGLFLRMYQVAEVPTILNRDEAALAYNALLLKETGLDEFGRPWPTFLESFGDFKLPGYPMLLVGAFQVLGYTDLAVRLPSVMAGTLLIFVAYVWAQRLFHRQNLSLLTAAVVAINPIFWFYSRIAYEANVGLLVFAIGVGCLLFNTARSRWLDLTGLGFIWWSVLLYNTPLLLIPFLVLSLILHRGVGNWQNWLGPCLGLGILFVGVFTQLQTLTAQKSSITIFSDESVWMQSVEYRQQFSGLSQKLLGNQYVFFGQIILRNILASVSPYFMVTSGGGHPWHTLPTWGHLYWPVYGLGWLGILSTCYGLITKKLKRFFTHLQLDIWSVFLFLTLAALAPAVVTVDAPHATRSLLFFWLWIFWAVKGFSFLQELPQLKSKSSWSIGSWSVIISWLIVSALGYGAQYFIQYPKQQPGELKSGFDQILNQVEQRYPEQQIAVVDPDGYHYILAAWYLKTPPTTFFETIVKQQPNSIGFRYGERFDRYHFIGQASDAVNEGEEVIVEWTGSEWQVLENGIRVL